MCARPHAEPGVSRELGSSLAFSECAGLCLDPTSGSWKFDVPGQLLLRWLLFPEILWGGVKLPHLCTDQVGDL